MKSISKPLKKNHLLFNTVIVVQSKRCHKIGLDIKKGKEEIIISMSEKDTNEDIVRIIQSRQINEIPDIERRIEAIQEPST